MSCFPCFKSQRSKKSLSRKEPADSTRKAPENQKGEAVTEAKGGEQADKNINAKAFNFRELATATKNFRQECLLGEGNFGKVFKGTIQSTGQVVAVKQLHRHGMQGSKEFLAEISALSLLNHPNLVNLVGYCADGDQRILVYEYMSGGSLESHLLESGPEKKPLDWFTRIKIASGAARGLEYLHEQANPPVIYRDLKASNILLDEEFNPKLSDIGLTKLSPSGDKMQGPSRMMGTYGYCAPEYTRSGEVSLKSDVYSFGVVLLEIITGRRAVDTTRPSYEQNLVTWTQPYFRDPKKFPDLADPLLHGKFPEKDLNQAVGIAAMCLQEESVVRPLISDVVTTLSFLTTIPPEGFDPIPASAAAAAASEYQEDKDDQDEARNKCSKDEDTYSKQSENDNSDDDDGDVSDPQDDKSEDECEVTTAEAKELNSKSSHKSNMSSDEGSDCSSRTGSSRSSDASVSPRSIGSSSRSDSNLNELSRTSSKGSHRPLAAISNQKRTKSTKGSDLKGQESRKSMETYESFRRSSSRGSTADLSASLSYKSSKRLQHGDAS